MVLAAAILVLGVIVTVAPVISFANAAPTVTFAGGVPAVVTVDDPAAEPRIYLSATGGREFVGLPLRVSDRRMPNSSGVPGSLVIEIVGFAGSSSVSRRARR